MFLVLVDSSESTHIFMWKCGIVVKESLLFRNERDVFSYECGAAIEFFSLVL